MSVEHIETAQESFAHFAFALRDIGKTLFCFVQIGLYHKTTLSISEAIDDNVLVISSLCLHERSYIAFDVEPAFAVLLTSDKRPMRHFENSRA